MTASTSVFDRAHRRTTAGLLMLVTFIAFEAMAVGTAMPTAVAELDGLAWYAWPFSAFLVASVVGMVVGGGVGDRSGVRVALPWGVAAFAGGLLTAGIAGNMAVFVAGRAVQGLGAGVIVVLLYVIAGSAYEPELRPRFFGAISAAWVLPALGSPGCSGRGSTRTAGRTSPSPSRISGSSPRKTTRQLACVVSRPATTGPTRAGSTQAVEIAPNSRGRSAGA